MKYILLLLIFISCASPTHHQAGHAADRYILDGDSSAWISVVDSTVVYFVRGDKYVPIDTVKFYFQNDTIKCVDIRDNNGYFIFIREQRSNY